MCPNACSFFSLPVVWFWAIIGVFVYVNYVLAYVHDDIYDIKRCTSHQTGAAPVPIVSDRCEFPTWNGGLKINFAIHMWTACDSLALFGRRIAFHRIVDGKLLLPYGRTQIDVE